jgi:hypothetical protein
VKSTYDADCVFSRCSSRVLSSPTQCRAAPSEIAHTWFFVHLADARCYITVSYFQTPSRPPPSPSPSLSISSKVYMVLCHIFQYPRSSVRVGCLFFCTRVCCTLLTPVTSLTYSTCSLPLLPHICTLVYNVFVLLVATPSHAHVWLLATFQASHQ